MLTSIWMYQYILWNSFVTISWTYKSGTDGDYLNHFLGAVSIRKTVLLGMVIPMLKIRRPTGRLIFNMGIPIPGKTVFYIETGPWWFRPNPTDSWAAPCLFTLVLVSLCVSLEGKPLQCHRVHVGGPMSIVKWGIHGAKGLLYGKHRVVMMPTFYRHRMWSGWTGWRPSWYYET